MVAKAQTKAPQIGKHFGLFIHSTIAPNLQIDNRFYQIYL